MPINPLNHHYAMENPASVYDEEAMTALELAGRTAAKVNETVKAFNELEEHTQETLDSIPGVVASDVEAHIQNGDFDHAIDVYAGNLETRVENLLGSVKEGSTTLDAEVIDVRVDASGNTHTTAGASVRYQVTELRNLCPRENLITKVDGGYYSSSGKYTYPKVKQNELYTDEKIPVVPGVPYVFSGHYYSADYFIDGESWCAIITYDANGNFIKRHEYSIYSKDFEWKITFTSGVHSVALCWRNGCGGTFKFEQGDYASPHTEKIGDNVAQLKVTGYWTANGLHDWSNLWTTRKEASSLPVPVTAGDKYTLYNFADGEDPWGCVIFFDQTGGVVDRLTFAGTTSRLIPFTVPTGTAYMAFSVRGAYVNDFACFKDVDAHLQTDGHKMRELHLTMEAQNSAIEGVVNRLNGVRGVAHRGYSTSAPENTLPAYRLAFEQGFECVECDVNITADGVPVLLHDSTIDRTSNGSGAISSMTLAQALAYDFGSWKSSTYAGTKIPTLRDFLILCRNLKLHPYIEIKDGAKDYAQLIVNTVRDCGMRGKVTFISFSASALSGVRNFDPTARLGYIPSAVNIGSFESVCKSLKTGANEVFLDTDYYSNSDIITRCKAENIPVEAWTVNDVNTIYNADPYVSGFTSDSINAPEALSEYAMGG